MCFASDRRALFRHLNVQKRSGAEVVLRAHIGAQFFISHLPRWLRTHRFSEPTFRPCGATKQWKTQCFATLLLFRAPASSFFWASFSPLSFFLRPFSSLTLPSPAFPSVQTVGSLTSKLPSMKWMWHGTSMAQSETKPMWCQTVHRNCDPGRRLECWGATIGDTPQVVDAPSLIGYVSLSYILHHTSSTAQGCGGSFKNRKPIGEIGCCESGMAERIHWWTERCLRSPLFLSLSLTIYLPTSLSSMYLSIYLSLSLFHLITYLPIYLSTYVPIYLSIYLSLSLSSVYLSSCLPVCLSICLSVYLSICGAVSFSVM